MKRLILALLFLIGLAHPVSAAVTAAQVPTLGAVSNTQNKVVAYGSNVTAGNLLVATVGWNGFHADTATVTDTQGNTWAVAGSKQVDTGQGYGTYIFWAVAGSSAANTITVAFSTNPQDVLVTLYEYNDSGGGTWGLDSTATGVDDQTGTAIDVGDITTTGSASPAVAVAMARFGSSNVLVAGTGWTMDQTDDIGSNVDVYGSESRITGGTGTISGDMTSGGSTYCGAMAAFKATGGGGGAAETFGFRYRRAM